MRTLNLLAALCIAGFAATIALASGETVDLGPAKVSLNLSAAGSYTIEKGESSELVHDYDEKISDFQYSIYPSTVTFDGTSDQVMVEVHKMSASEALDEQIPGRRAISALEHCIEQADMMPRRAEYEAKSFTIDGHEGTLLTVDTGKDEPFYIAAYSPDEKDGSGSIVCIIGSDFPWETTKGILDSVKTQLA